MVNRSCRGQELTRATRLAYTGRGLRNRLKQTPHEHVRTRAGPCSSLQMCGVWIRAFSRNGRQKDASAKSRRLPAQNACAPTQTIRRHIATTSYPHAIWARSRTPHCNCSTLTRLCKDIAKSTPTRHVRLHRRKATFFSERIQNHNTITKRGTQGTTSEKISPQACNEEEICHGRRKRNQGHFASSPTSKTPQMSLWNENARQPHLQQPRFDILRDRFQAST